MGNQTFTQQQNLWQWIGNENGIETYRHKVDGRLAEKRRISISQSTIPQEMKIYDYRKLNNDGLIKSYQAIVINNIDSHAKTNNICSNQHQYIDVYTERIVDRLSNLPQLTFQETLYILKTILPACQVIYKKNGAIHINSELIGFTENGEAKIWVNENWALNNPSHYIPTLKTLAKRQYYENIAPQYRDESQMISNLYSVLQDTTENGKFPSPFNEQLKNKPKNFRQVKKFLKKYIESELKNTIPTSIQRNKLSSNSKSNQINSGITHNPPKVGSFNSISSINQPSHLFSQERPHHYQSNTTSFKQTTYNQPISTNYQFNASRYQPQIQTSRPSYQTNALISNSRSVIPSYQSNLHEFKSQSYKPFQFTTSNHKPFEFTSLSHQPLEFTSSNSKPLEFTPSYNRSYEVTGLNNVSHHNFEISQAKTLSKYLPQDHNAGHLHRQTENKLQFTPFYPKQASNIHNHSSQFHLISHRIVSPLASQVTESNPAETYLLNNSNQQSFSHSATYKIQGGKLVGEVKH